MNINIRLETEKDYRVVEEITRQAFWNLYVPGCNEHYLAHVMRSHPDFFPDLDFVAEYNGRVIGNIMYSKSHITNKKGDVLETITFGPLSVLPEFQRKGVGSALIEHTRKLVEAKGYPAILIFGNPGNYVKHGFVSCKRYDISYYEGKFPSGLLVLALKPEVLANNEWVFRESDVCALNEDEVEAFDKTFAPMEKGTRPSQEEFFILSSSSLA